MKDTIYDYCIDHVKEFQIEHRLDNKQARFIYSELIVAVQRVTMNLEVPNTQLAEFGTALYRHNRAVDSALSAIQNGQPFQIKVVVQGKKPVTINSQLIKTKRAVFNMFDVSKFTSFLSSIKNQIKAPSPRRPSKQTLAIKCFVSVAHYLVSIGISKNKTSGFIHGVLDEMGFGKISLQQIFKTLFA